MSCNDRQLTQSQRETGFDQQRTGVQRGVRPFTQDATPENIAEYLNREVFPVLKQARDKINETYLQVADNAPSGNPLGYYFSTETANADPTSGFIRLDNATQESATTIRVSQSNGRLVDVTPWLDVMSGSATSPLGVVTLSHAINPGRFVRFDLTSMTDQGAYWDLAVTAVESSHDNPFVQGDQVAIGFIAGVSSGTTTVAPGSISPIAAGTVLANVTAAPASPTAHSLTTLAGGGLTYTNVTGIMAVGAGDGIDVNADDVAVDVTDIVDNVTITEVATNNIQRAALTGFAAAAAGSNATTSAEPIVTYSASANMSAERVLTSGTNTAVDVSVANQIRVNVDDFPLTGLADQAAETFNGNFTAGSAPPTARAGSSVAGAGLTYAAGGTLAVGAGTRITVNANDVQLAAGAAESFLMNATSGSAVADYRAGSSVAGAGLTYAAGGTLAVGAGTGITANANDVAVNQAATFAWTGSHTWGHRVHFTGTLTTTINADTHNLAIGNVNTVLATVGGATPDLTGMVAAADGQVVLLCNVSLLGTEQPLNLVHESASSSAANRFFLPNEQDVSIPRGGGILLRYDSDSQFWFAVDAQNWPGLSVTLSPTTTTQVRLVEFIEGSGINLTLGTAAGYASITAALSNELTIPEHASTPSTSAGFGTFWVNNVAPTAAMFTDDEGEDWAVGYACVSVNTTTPTATNATTNLSCGGAYNIPADTARVGTLYRLTGQYLFDHTAAATPTITHELLIDGSVVDSRVVTPIATATFYHGRIIGEIRFQTLGATGTVMATTFLNTNYPVTYDFGIIGTSTTTTDTVDTTQALTIELRVRMTTAVASNTLTVLQGYIERLA